MAERLGGRPLYAPTLLPYELASVCGKKARAEPAKEDRLRSALGLFSRLRVQEVRVPPEELVGVARETGLTAYDAAYLWLARELGAELVSLDAHLDAAGR